MIEFRVLGSVVALQHDRSVALAPRQRIALAALVVNAGRITSVDQLSRWLWDDHPPATAGTAVQVHISQLRKRLALGPERTAAPHLLTQAPGYLLQLVDAKSDLATFRRALLAARRHRDADELTDAARAYRDALGVVRGDPLAGLPTTAPVLRAAERIGLEVLAAQEEWIRVQLREDPYPDLIVELDRLVARHPHREALLCLLVEALHRDGRRIEALEVLRDGRARLTGRPGARLHELERALLARPAASAAVTAQATSAAPPPPVALVGRGQLLDHVYAVLAGGLRTAARPTALIAGPPGVGKTALALAVAERLAERYPDGRIYVTADDPPETDPVGLLRRALYTLDGGGLEAGLDADELADRVRRRVDGRRMLLIVDGVHHERQVAALASADWAGVLMTTLGAPAMRHEPVTLDVLDEASAVDLLRRGAGQERVTALPEAARLIVDRCDRLPIAIRAAGARLAGCPHWTLADLADRLADPRHRLDQLHCGDLDVRAVIDRAYRAVPAPTRAAFGRLAWTSRSEPPGNDTPWELTVAGAAATLGTTRDEAARTLHGLARAGLLLGPRVSDRPEPRYRLLGLLAWYGRERGRRVDP